MEVQDEVIEVQNASTLERGKIIILKNMGVQVQIGRVQKVIPYFSE